MKSWAQVSHQRLRWVSLNIHSPSHVEAKVPGRCLSGSVISVDANLAKGKSATLRKPHPLPGVRLRVYIPALFFLDSLSFLLHTYLVGASAIKKAVCYDSNPALHIAAVT